MSKNLLILGGYGNTGRLIARLLLQHSDVQLVLAGRNLDRATGQAEAFNREFSVQRVTALRVDAADPQSLRRAYRGVDLVVAASSTAQYVETVARTALEAGIDYLDVQYASAKVEALQALRDEIERSGRCFITDGGFHPGLPAALVRYAAGQFERLERADVASVIKIDWGALEVSPATVEELAVELTDFRMQRYHDGRWRGAGWTGYVPFDFGPPFGRQPCAPMMLEEMRSLPQQIPTLQETGFYVGGFNWFVDYVAMPLGWVAMRLAPGQALTPAGGLMHWGLRTFSRPPYGTILQLEASGVRQGRPGTLRLTLRHDDGYLLTAAPVAACLLQWLDGTIGRPGLRFQGQVVDPERLLADVATMGISVDVAFDVPLSRRKERPVTTPARQRKQWSELTPGQQRLIAVSGLVQVLLAAAALWDIRRRPAAEIRGKKWAWSLAAGTLNFVGPLAYFLLGRK